MSLEGLRVERIVDGLYYGEVYFVNGKPSESGKKNEVHSAHWAGNGAILVLDRGAKNITLFAPYQLESFSVSRNSYEALSLRPTKYPFDRASVLRCLHRGWENCGIHGIAGDFDTAARVLQMLGEPVPMRIVPEGAEPDKPRGGKEAEAVLGLLKPVKRTGRRGQVLAFFMGGARSIREAMAEFDVSRSNLLSQLWLLQKEHGIGYTLVGDAAQVMLPAGCEDPFEPEAKAA
jgi:hypothetical protein